MEPDVSDALFIADTASIIGDVRLAPGVTVWYNATLRGDVNAISIGENSNFQDNCVAHGNPVQWAVNVGKRVTVGHGVILHGCTIGDDCLIGMGAVILDGCEVGSGCIIAAGTVLLQGTVIPARSLVAGVPGKVRREVTQEEQDGIIRESWEYYVGLGERARRSVRK